MKLMMIALAAAVATPALAQTMPAPPPAADPAMTPPTAPAPPADPAMTPPAAPAAPADPAMAPPPPPPAGPAMSPPPPPPAMTPPATSDGNYPTCSRTVTDHCTERSAKRPRR